MKNHISHTVDMKDHISLLLTSWWEAHYSSGNNYLVNTVDLEGHRETTSRNRTTALDVYLEYTPVVRPDWTHSAYN